jgi:hypothetical protein
MIIRTYSDLIRLPTFEERFEYLRLDGMVGKDTFGFDRYLNQLFYKSIEWKNIRNYIITRDLGCDLAIPELEILGRIYIHHINPLMKEDILNGSKNLLDPEFLICVSYDTHQAIHYGNTDRLPKRDLIIRTKNDTCPWRH